MYITTYQRDYLVKHTSDSSAANSAFNPDRILPHRFLPYTPGIGGITPVAVSQVIYIYIYINIYIYIYKIPSLCQKCFWYFLQVMPLILQKSFYGVTVNGVNVPTGQRHSPHERVTDFLYSGYQYDLNGGRTDSFSRRQVSFDIAILIRYWKILGYILTTLKIFNNNISSLHRDRHTFGFRRETRSIINKHYARRRYGSPGKQNSWSMI